ncbi:Endonuclease/exonuclease/phosphatase [Chytriomyces sp. MP71]|nr:Endonuclease/exonuclease/phosphatase [Chytriomyces sp. MP71]
MKVHPYNASLSSTSILNRDSMTLCDSKLRESRCTRTWSQNHISSLRIFVGTWNMNGTVPRCNTFPFLNTTAPREKDGGDSPAILDAPRAKPSSKFNLIAIGCQEARHTRAFRIWLDTCLKSYESDGYALVRVVKMGSLSLVLLAAWWMMASIRIQTGCATKNLFNRVLGNKGAVYACLDFKGLTILFVNCHFSAHQERVSERRNDYKKLSTKISAQFKCHHEVEAGDVDLQQKFDHVFWFGDLNYRVNGTRSMVDLLLQRQDQEVMLSNDQLVHEMKHGHVLDGFNESLIRFPPSYKFDTYKPKRWRIARSGRNVLKVYPGGESCLSFYDTSNKCRIPSWTDRILFSTRANDDKEVERVGIVCESYDCAMDSMESDHKPVFGEFSLSITQ